MMTAICESVFKVFTSHRENLTDMKLLPDRPSTPRNTLTHIRNFCSHFFLSHVPLFSEAHSYSDVVSVQQGHLSAGIHLFRPHTVTPPSPHPCTSSPCTTHTHTSGCNQFTSHVPSHPAVPD